MQLSCQCTLSFVISAEGRGYQQEVRCLPIAVSFLCSCGCPSIPFKATSAVADLATGLMDWQATNCCVSMLCRAAHQSPPALARQNMWPCLAKNSKPPASHATPGSISTSCLTVVLLYDCGTDKWPWLKMHCFLLQRACKVSTMREWRASQVRASCNRGWMARAA